METRIFTAIVARRVSDKAIGHGMKIPWNIPEDTARFRDRTSRTPHSENPLPVQFNICVMGRKTFESLPRGYLPNRRIFVLSQRGGPRHLSHPLVEFYPTRDLLLKAVSESLCRDVFICGGQRIYEEFIDLCDYVDLTEVIQGPGPADTFFHDRLLSEDFEPVPEGGKSPPLFSREGGVPFHRVLYRRRHPERVYLDIAERILEAGRVKGDRTGTGTLSVFGPRMEFDLREGFPLLTTKRVFWHGVLEELFWFISGSTDSKKLSERGVRIWDGNSSRDFLDRRGLETYVEGDIGPGYGFQWRHWGAKYSGCGRSYGDEGVDQLSEVVRQIRDDPSSRRMVVSAWNVSDLAGMALPPCHLLFQFNVEDQFLDLKMYQRSGDWFLGVPFNIASYGILLTLVAHLTGKVARRLVMTYGDAHIYANHREQMGEQLLRNPLRMARVQVMDRNQQALEDYVTGDISLHGYNPHPSIRAPMAV